jgi:hypothetical protein
MNHIVLRIAGFADEPGAFALILTYLIVINEVSFKKNKYRIIYLIAGILSFSIAFIITILPLILYWIYNKILPLKKLGSIISIVLLSFGVFNTVNNSFYNTFDQLVFKRLEISDSNSISGDNRSSSKEFQLQAFYENPILGVGTNFANVELSKYKLFDPSFFSFLGIYGIYGYIFLYIPFFYLLFSIPKKYLLLLFAIGINFLQRPGLEHIYILVSLSLIYYCANYFSNEVSST